MIKKLRWHQCHPELVSGSDLNEIPKPASQRGEPASTSEARQVNSE
jgi:hypothetical protein